MIKLGEGPANIDLEAATANGVVIADLPGNTVNSICELAFALLLNINRRIPSNVNQLREGKWNKNEFSKATGVKGKNVTVLGYGPVG